MNAIKIDVTCNNDLKKHNYTFLKKIKKKYEKGFIVIKTRVVPIFLYIYEI